MDRLGSLSLVRQLVQEKEKYWIQNVRNVVRRIYGTPAHHSSVICWSEKCGWLYMWLLPYKQINNIGNPVAHIFNWPVEPSYRCAQWKSWSWYISTCKYFKETIHLFCRQMQRNIYKLQSIKLLANLYFLYIYIYIYIYIVLTLFLYKSFLLLGLPCYQFFFTNCRITIHYFLPYIYILE